MTTYTDPLLTALQSGKQRRVIIAVDALTAAGVTFHSNNNNIHLQITSASGQRLDFWPSTDMWRVQGSKQKCHTLAALLDHLSKAV